MDKTDRSPLGRETKFAGTRTCILRGMNLASLWIPRASPNRDSVVALILLALTLSACGVDGLNFREDDRLQFTSPEHRSTVSLPVTLRWDIEDFEVTGPTDETEPDAGYFAVFVDRAPQPPGESLSWLVRDDPQCVSDPDCPDGEDLAQLGVYPTDETQLTLDVLQDLSQTNQRFHEVTVVLLDGHGRRIGESAFAIEFQVDREAERR